MWERGRRIIKKRREREKFEKGERERERERERESTKITQVLQVKLRI